MQRGAKKPGRSVRSQIAEALDQMLEKPWPPVVMWGTRVNIHSVSNTARVMGLRAKLRTLNDGSVKVLKLEARKEQKA